MPNSLRSLRIRMAALAAPIAVMFAGASPASAEFSFAPPLNRAAGDFPMRVATGDLNGDGRSDLATADWQSASVKVLLADDRGGFEPAASYPVDRSPYAILIDDLNLDGRLDVATANSNADSISVLIGTGDGDFKPSFTQTFPGDSPMALAAGDLDGDQVPDLVTANRFSDNLSVFYASLDVQFGYFTPWIPKYGGHRPSSVAIADLNLDGWRDLVFTHDAGVSVHLGVGQTEFQGPLHYAAGQFPEDLAIGDLNGDGRPDVAVANAGSDDVSVLLGREQNGLFGPPVSYPVGANMGSIAIGDLDADGALDILAEHTKAVAVLRGGGDGTFRAAENYQVDNEARDVAIGDVNGDGRPDVIASGDPLVSILLNTSTPTASPNARAVGFGRKAVGTVTGSHTIRFTNRGHARLDVGAARTTGSDADEFRIASDECVGESLAPGESCKVALRFAPVAEGPASAALRLASNAPAPSTVALRGTGTPIARPPTAGPKGPGPGAVIDCTSRRDARGKLRTRCPVPYAAVEGNRVLSGRLARGTRVYASHRRLVHPGRDRIVLRGQRAIPAGRYLLLLRFVDRDGDEHLVAQPVRVGA